MANHAIPFYGIDRAEHILNIHTLRVLIVLGYLSLAGCDTQSQAAIGYEGNDARQSQAIPLSELWSELVVAPQNSVATHSVSFPDDIKAHPEAAIESVQLRAIVSDTNNRWVSVQLQLDRLALNLDKDTESGWGYSQIMRSSSIVGYAGDQLSQTTESVQRRALGLADSRPGRLHVLDSYMDIRPASLHQAATNSCDYLFDAGSDVLAEHQLTTPLSWRLDACPAAMDTGVSRGWTVSGVPVRIGQSDAGIGWVSNQWGNLPAPGGAVVIDRMELVLSETLSQASGGSVNDRPLDTDSGTRLLSSDAWILSANRSKRRSGRGPQTVSGTLAKRGKEMQSIQLVWRDEGQVKSSVSGDVYPAGFTVASESQSLQLILTPLVAIAEVNDSLGSRWSGAVKVNGTHTGLGFVDFVPVAVAADGDQG